MRVFYFILSFIPSLLLGQWQLDFETGANLSMNQTETLAGNPHNFSNSARPGGYWGVNTKCEIHPKLLLFTGVNHSAYKYQYRYKLNRIGENSAKSMVYIWGFPLGIEAKLIDKNIGLHAGIGAMYRYNGSGSPFSYSFVRELKSPSGETITRQTITEESAKYQNHMISLLSYLTIQFKLKNHLNLGIKLSYNHGFIEHESFNFEALTEYPQEGFQSLERYRYSSNASFLALGLSLNIKLQAKEKEVEVFPD